MTLKNEIRLFLVCLTFFVGLIVLAASADSKRPTTEQQDKDFAACSQNEGDLGCDSCYYRIYGRLINPFTGEDITHEVKNPLWIQAHQDYLNSKK